MSAAYIKMHSYTKLLQKELSDLGTYCLQM